MVKLRRMRNPSLNLTTTQGERLTNQGEILHIHLFNDL